MVKRKLINFVGILVVFIFFLQFVSATCVLGVELVNQDPYPALPGEYVELVFQVSGVENPDCGGAVFELIPKYPFSLEEGEEAQRILQGSTYIQGYKKEWIVPYKLMVNSNALDGSKELEVRYNKGVSMGDTYFSKEFNISVEDVRTDFEVSVKDYDKENKEILFEILNIGEHNVEALTIEIPEQKNVILRKGPRMIIGSLDSNEEETFTFNAELKRGEINLTIIYTDQVNERRSINKSVFFEPSYFQATKKSGGSFWIYLILIGVIVFVIFWIRKKRKDKKQRHNR